MKDGLRVGTYIQSVKKNRQIGMNDYEYNKIFVFVSRKNKGDREKVKARVTGKKKC